MAGVDTDGLVHCDCLEAISNGQRSALLMVAYFERIADDMQETVAGLNVRGKPFVMNAKIISIFPTTNSRRLWSSMRRL